MKKIITIFTILTTFTLPTTASSSKCEIKARGQASQKWNFDYDNEIPQKYKDRISSIINSPVTTDIQGQCSPGGIFNCHPGDIYKECCPCADFRAERQVKEEYVNDFIKEQCSESNNTNTKSSTITTTAVAQEPQQPETDSAGASASASADDAQQPETDSANASASTSAGDTDTVLETISVTGTIMYPDKSPAFAASVCQTGKSTWDACRETESDGTFELHNIPANATITITMLGYQNYETKAAPDIGTIYLQDSPENIDAATTVSSYCTGKKLTDINATAADFKSNPNGQGGQCIPTACITPRYKLENNTCIDQVGKSCSDESITDGTYKMSGNDLVCVAKTCACGYKKDGNKCIEMSANECSKTIKHATELYRTCDGELEICEVTKCQDGYTPAVNGESCIKKGKKCTAAQNQSHKNATETGITDDTGECVAISCKCGYDVIDGRCVAWPQEGRPCDEKYLPKNAKSGTMDCRDDKPYCKISKCINDEYKPDAQGNKCTSLKRTPCTSTDNNATDATYKTVNNKLVCIINACKTGYEPDADGTKCVAKSVLSEKDSQKKIAELSDNADKMHERENSAENKALGAAGMASVGIGGMQMASAMAEKNADADAELAMRAYLSTFSCDYGGGSVSGGTTNNELPGGNELIGLYGEYVNLANNLKARKAALDIRPGIESEPILDSATSGLYDDISDGITTGAYTSLARAIMDPSGADAAAWASRQSDTAQKLKTGAMAAGIGSVATLVGNQLINSGEENQEKSADINASYEKLKRPYTPPSK